MIQHDYDVIIIGAGPAGLAASTSSLGATVALVDDNPWLGGQIWRGMKLVDHKNNGRLDYHLQTSIFDAPGPGVLFGLKQGQVIRLTYKRLILATGARELFLPFKGWTLPNILGAGGLQALAKGGLDLKGKRVVVAGSGPLLLAVAAYLKVRGTIIPALYEQTNLRSLAAFGLAAAGAGGKLDEAWSLISKVGPQLRPGCWITEAYGTGKLEGVIATNGRKTWRVSCDYLATSYGLVPNLELPTLLGCQIDNGFVRIDGRQQTSIENVFCAGEPTGIGGVDKATNEGVVAAISAADPRTLDEHLKTKLITAQRKVANSRKFVQKLESSFQLRDELKNLAPDDTIVCRCEDVRMSQLRSLESARDAKLQTRCGMGPCQGRVCGPALRHLFGWQPDSIRPPIIPVPASAFAEPD